MIKNRRGSSQKMKRLSAQLFKNYLYSKTGSNSEASVVR